MTISKGSAVRYSRQGLATLRRKQRTGKCVGYTRDGNYINVNWDGLSPHSIYTFAPRFIARNPN